MRIWEQFFKCVLLGAILNGIGGHFTSLVASETGSASVCHGSLQAMVMANLPSANATEPPETQAMGQVDIHRLNQQLEILQWKHITWQDGLEVGGILLAAILFGRILLGTLLTHFAKKMRHWQWNTHAAILRVTEAPFSAFVLLTGAYLAGWHLAGDDHTLQFLSRFYSSCNLLLLTWLLMRWNDALFDRICQRERYQQSDYFGILPVLKRAARLIIGLIGLLMVVDSLGYSVTGLFATLGIGGALIALSAKDTVANMFGSLCIVLDRPFRVGDWIANRDSSISGDVESIGLRSTKIRTPSKSLMIVPNALLTNEVIDNWSRMQRRLSKQFLHLQSTTSPEQIDRLRIEIESMLQRDREVQSDTFFLAFAEFEERTFKLHLQYYTFALDLKPFMEVRHRINQSILDAAKRLQIQLSVASETHENEIETRKMAAR